MFTSWTDLDSNPVNEVKKGLDALSGRDGIAVIIRNTDSSFVNSAEKSELIQEFINENDYRECYQNGEYTVYVR